MKNLIISLLVGMFFPCMLHSQYNRIKTDPIDFALSTATVQYERFLPNQWSLQLGMSLTQFHTVVWDEVSVSVTGVGVTPEVRYYFRPYASSDVPKGFFGGGWARYNTGKGTFDLESEGIHTDMMDVTAYSGGVLVGYQHIIWNRLCLEALAGGGYRSSKIEGRMAEAGEKIFFTRSGFIPKAGINVGIAF
ncbi:MAG: DUF3575 domain-containing protein [Bacteroidia bacterium]